MITRLTRKSLPIAIGIILIFSVLAGPLNGQVPIVNADGGTPSIDIVSVSANESVTIITHDFPANQLFTVRMGALGTLGVGGPIVATTNSGAGGSFQVTYPIPDSLKSQSLISIRLDSDKGFYAYNTFTNQTGGTSAGSTVVSSGGTMPTFRITGVAKDTSVTVLTSNFPSNQLFTVRMGAFGTLAVDGIIVGTTNSGAGGSFQETYNIPDALKGAAKIAIRLESQGGVFAYNYFDNTTGYTGGTGSSGTTTSGSTTTTTTTVIATTVPYTSTTTLGSTFANIPTFTIAGVTKDNSVTVITSNFPASKTFTVRMGAFGTRGISGIAVATTDSGAGGSFQATYTIPDALKGSSQIAIRMESTTNNFYAYNWFYNNGTTAVISTTPAPGQETAATPAAATAPLNLSVIPTFRISKVVRNDSVTIAAVDFPAGQTFLVRMGAFGTLGLEGPAVDSVDTGKGGSFEATYKIPDTLKGSDRIAIRFESPSGYFSYNWFYNASIN